MRALDRYHGSQLIKYAFQLTANFFVRSGKMRLAEWEVIRQIIQPEERHGLLANEIGTGSVRDRPSATGGRGTLGRDPQLPGAQHDPRSDAGRRPGLFLPLKLHNPRYRRDHAHP